MVNRQLLFVVLFCFVMALLGQLSCSQEDESCDECPEPDDDDDDDDDDDNDDDTAESGCIVGDFVPVFGMLHSHSIFSDGKGLPSEAYAWARDEGDLDFFALTDHLEILYLPLPPNKWQMTKQTADQFDDPGTYVALAGYEYSSGIDFEASKLEGRVIFSAHNNVFFVDYMFPQIMLDFHLFYDELLKSPDSLAQFNHPGWEGQTNWNEFAYEPELDGQINLIELSTWNLDAWPYLFECLDQGWHVSPTWNQDNHNKGWGTQDDHRTGAWVQELTREGIRQVMIERRTFSTLDRNATLALSTADGCWMGSILTDRSSAELVVEAIDPDPADGFASLELWSNGQELVWEHACDGEPTCTLEVDVAPESPGAYVLARAVQLDGDLLVSAPIWLGP